MGKRYTTELSLLSETYRWARSCDILDFATSIRDTGQHPLLAVGSGGSFTVATYWAMIHEYATGRLAKSGTPIDLLATPSVRPYAIGLVTAEGSNPDFVHACENAQLGEPKGIVVLTFAEKSRLTRRIPKLKSEDIVSFEPPVKKDGFLATNSLLAFLVLLYRAYHFDNSEIHGPWPTISETATISPTFNRTTYSLLYAGWGIVAAKDIESKLVESGMADVHQADVRNFAHGRHVWMARRASTTTVIALITPSWEPLFDQTLAVLPPDVQVIRLQASVEGPLAAIELVTKGLSLIGEIASQQNVDPGKPTVPKFGRQLYRLRFRRLDKSERKPSIKTLLSRKFGNTKGGWLDSATTTVKQDLNEYLHRLRTTTFGGIVFDYDETLSPRSNRFGNLQDDMSNAITKIVGQKITLGVASGRGRSVGDALRQSLEKRIWNEIVIGYYNGSEIRMLDDGPPSRSGHANSELARFGDTLRQHHLLNALCGIEERPTQISLVTKRNVPIPVVHDLINELLISGQFVTLAAKCSSHAIDVLAPGISKQAVVDVCNGILRSGSKQGHVLSVGDSGNWYGNDFDLLSTPHSLSVANCPTNTLWAWNLAGPGHVGPEATLDYINAMRFHEGSFTLDVDSLVGDYE